MTGKLPFAYLQTSFVASLHAHLSPGRFQGIFLKLKLIFTPWTEAPAQFSHALEALGTSVFVNFFCKNRTLLFMFTALKKTPKKQHKTTQACFILKT